jgi:lysophospholipase L1-like esterase
MRKSVPIIFLAVLLTVPWASGAAADTPQGPMHLALGDSQAFGYGTPRPDHLGYVAYLARWLHAVGCEDGPACPHLEEVNLAVPGARSWTLISDQLPEALALLADRNGDTEPGNDVIYITVTIGGNDIFNPVVGACGAGATPECQAVIQSAFTQYQTNLAHILGSLRAAAGATTRIVIATYDNPLAACYLAPMATLGDLVLEGGPGLPVGFNQIIEGVAAATGAEVAEMYGQLAAKDWVGGDDCTHPNSRGYRAMASVFLGVLD